MTTSENLFERAYRTARIFFFAGLLVLIPPALTLLLLYKVWEWLDDLVVTHLPAPGAADVTVRILASLAAILLPVLTIMLAGAAAHTYIGKGLQGFYERMITRVPILGRVFTWLRQIAEMVFADQREVFNRVALVEYPRKGIWTLAFVSSPAAQEIRAKSGSELVSIFVPTTPNPTSGFLLMMPASELVLLEMTPEEALRIILSGGIIAPENRHRPADPPAPPASSTP